MLLSICIPTYNRSKYLPLLLSFLENEIKNIDPIFDIEILISNNDSTDDSERIILDSSLYQANRKIVRYWKNDKNLGLIGNFQTLYKKAQGEYVWLMGDDDIYHTGILNTLCKELNPKIYSFVFFNHCVYENHRGDKTGFDSAIGNIDSNQERKKVLLDIFNYSGGTLMFISATVHKREHILDLLSKGWKINLAYPLMQSFYSATKGPIKIIKEIYIEDCVSNISWKKQHREVFLNDIPYILLKLFSMGYRKQDVVKTNWKYLAPKFLDFLRYQIKRNTTNA